MHGISNISTPQNRLRRKLLLREPKNVVGSGANKKRYELATENCIRHEHERR